jgi:hypothetical protein
MLVVKS